MHAVVTNNPLHDSISLLNRMPKATEAQQNTNNVAMGALKPFRSTRRATTRNRVVERMKVRGKVNEASQKALQAMHGKAHIVRENPILKLACHAKQRVLDDPPRVDDRVKLSPRETASELERITGWVVNPIHIEGASFYSEEVEDIAQLVRQALKEDKRGELTKEDVKFALANPSDGSNIVTRFLKKKFPRLMGKLTKRVASKVVISILAALLLAAIA
ncbi:MAG: hypothetical protein MRY21_01650 [Simkaniaceae bacterium]|nr:hypothetical protein [Simkaniaceae bacterium]